MGRRTNRSLEYRRSTLGFVHEPIKSVTYERQTKNHGSLHWIRKKRKKRKRKKRKIEEKSFSHQANRLTTKL
jgi:hypothetical protein